MWPLRWPMWPSWWQEERRPSREPGRPAERAGGRGLRLRRRRRREAEEVVSEAETFLRGGLAERFEHEAGFVPVWAWTNRLAHGTETELRAENVGLRPIGVATADRWRRARAFLAGEVLDAARRYGSLGALQRDVLVPLELDLSQSAETDALGLAEWVLTVEAALREACSHPSGRG